MKSVHVRIRPCGSTGFTLVELLVVVAIIAILAGVLLSAANGVINSAKKAKASSYAQQIQTACLSYYTEYSVYPVPTTFTAGSGDYLITDATPSTGWQNLIEALAGNLSPYNPTTTVTPNVPNTRAIAFLSLKASDVDSTDCPVNPITPNPTTSKYFNIAIDADYDGLLGTTGNTSGKLPNVSKSTATTQDLTGTSTAGVALWANCNAPGYTSFKNWITTY